MALTTAQTAKLTALQNYGTKYELVLTDGTESFRIAYAARNNRSGLISAVRNRAEDIRLFVGVVEPTVTFGKRASDPVKVDGTPWSIRWSGRTQREAITSGELAGLSAPRILVQK